MSQSYVIEIDDESVGVVVRGDGERRFVFHAARSGFGALEGRSFSSVKAAEKAASSLLRHRSMQRIDRPASLPRVAAGGR